MGLGDGVGDALGDALRVAVDAAVTVGVAVPVRVGDVVAVLVDVAVALAVAVKLGPVVGVRVGLPVGVSVGHDTWFPPSIGTLISPAPDNATRAHPPANSRTPLVRVGGTAAYCNCTLAIGLPLSSHRTRSQRYSRPWMSVHGLPPMAETNHPAASGVADQPSGTTSYTDTDIGGVVTLGLTCTSSVTGISVPPP